MKAMSERRNKVNYGNANSFMGLQNTFDDYIQKIETPKH